MTSSTRLPMLRRLLLALLVFGIVGTSAELLLLHHYEDMSMTIPLAINGLALLVIAAHAAGGGTGSVYALRIIMALMIAAGVIGVVLHFQGNMEFQVEMDPQQPAWELFKKVMTAQAPPALAPGVMAQLGLLGLVYTYRHPALRLGDVPHSWEHNS